MSIELLKRAPDELELAAKRTKQDLVVAEAQDNLPPRTSDLEAPIMHLTGHAAEVSMSKFLVLSIGLEPVINMIMKKTLSGFLL